MKYSLITCLLLSFSLAFAQSDLFVSSGSYIYVDGTGFTPGPNVAPLFVTDDINLDTNSHIYLRNEAQLLQGSGTTGNSGEGRLSIYQTGNVNQWSYNYWCSPVGNNSATNGNEDSRVELLNDVTDPITSVPALFTSAFDGIASPLTISDRWLWTYQTSSSYADWVYVGSTGAISPGLGFTMKGNGTGTTGSQLYDFRGKPNNGTITNPVSDGDFTLIGNPYPSALDARDFIHDPLNINEIDGTLFYWEQNGTVASHVLQDYIGGYATYTIDAAGTMETFNFALFFTYDEQDNSTPVFTPPPMSAQAEGTKIAGRYVPVGQGFMVEGIAGPNGIVTVKNSHRDYIKEGTDSFFFRTTLTNNGMQMDSNTDQIQYQDNGLSIVPDDYKRFRVNVDFTVGNSQYTRQLVLNFHDTATLGYDRGLELKRAQGYASDAYFNLENKDYCGQAYPFEEALTIPLVIDIEEQQPLRFRIFDIQNFEDSQGIYIHDIENALYVNLRNQDYELNIEPGNYTNRFEIVFAESEVLSIDDLDVNDLSIRQNNDSQQLHIINPKGLDVKSIEVFDVAGKQILDGLYDSILNRYSLSTADLSEGVYIVNVSSNANTIKSEKIIVKH
ncbi:T9SS type A sorting domain-containing protein [Winogradskyella sp.]|uniref:T9SS type A sorting domain-containing protein n=1 Tax=Winogradskyella sp. TaxID=1883156 RepID=UPI002611CBD1|nr:T9SS type A sorting domain-containing protein [Winogradskyella sp.]